MISKKLKNFSNIDFNEGETLLINKEIGRTSFWIVEQIRRVTRAKKVGHAGTLDPAATGLLIICTGKKTKQINEYQDLGKSYSGVITLGKKTETMDGESEFIEEKNLDGITEEMIDETRKKFVGAITQIPPMFSAVKHKGKPLYQYARKGKEVKREPRRVEVYYFEIEKIELPDIYFRIDCSKGTYIRSIANDFGDLLGVGAYLSRLRRNKIGEYRVEDSFTLDEFKDFYFNLSMPR